jgi:hypothetical protein
MPLQHSNSTRLVILFPGEFSSTIRISLIEVSTQREQWYEALSYIWATEDGDCQLSSQIQRGDRIIWVTKNCELALRYLRKEDLPRTLWVDAICINQKDDKERGHQVGFMRDVYAKATEVVVLLGEASKDLASPLLVALSPQSEHMDPSSLLERIEGPKEGPELLASDFNSHI